MKISNNRIVFDGGFAITLHRTVRLPEDGNNHDLPPSHGAFPMKRLEDYQDKVPASWKGHGGVMIPMHEREAMWIGFDGSTSAVKIATGKVNAVSGGKWSEELQPPTGVDGKDPEQDYMVGPSPQRWLDGYNIGKGVIRQFVAQAMGKGYTVEAQVTGKEDVGGIQVLVVPAKPGAIKPSPVYRGYSALMSCADSMTIPSFESDFSGGSSEVMYESCASMGPTASAGPQASSMDSDVTKGISGVSTKSMRRGAVRSASLPKSAEIGLAQGGRMTQEISVDPHGIDTWDMSKSERIFIHIVNAQLWEEITGEKCPPSPVPATEYKGAYFTYDSGEAAVNGSGTLANVKPVSEKDKEHGFTGQQDDSELNEKQTNPTVKIHAVKPPKNVIKDGIW